MEKLSVVNLPRSTDIEIPQRPGLFVLKTCQRILFIGRGNFLSLLPCSQFEFYTGTNAYQFLLEVICGLKSHLVAENEITGQFKEAYKNYLECSERDNSLLSILEKLFKDTKTVRGQFLNSLGGHSYASVTRLLLTKYQANKKVLLVGSGSLAFSLAKILKKKFDLTVCARNPVTLNELTNAFALQKESFENKENFYNYPTIINTVSTEELFFNDEFFHRWNNEKTFFVDLSSPSSIKTSKNTEDRIFRLEDIYKESYERNDFREIKVAQAREYIGELAYRRHELFKLKDNFLGQ